MLRMKLVFELSGSFVVSGSLTVYVGGGWASSCMKLIHIVDVISGKYPGSGGQCVIDLIIRIFMLLQKFSSACTVVHLHEFRIGLRVSSSLCWPH